MKRLLPIVSALKGLSLPRWGAAFACLALAGCGHGTPQRTPLQNAGLYTVEDTVRHVICYSKGYDTLSCVRIPQRPAIIGLQGGDIAGASGASKTQAEPPQVAR